MSSLSAGDVGGGGVMSRFCDYFVVCGLDDNSGLEVLSTVDVDGTRETPTCAPLERSYKPKILAHYPESVPWNPFDPDAVRNLCLPDGLLFRTQKHDLSTAFHPFVITREDGSRAYGYSLVFFEPLSSTHVAQAILTLQAMHLTELSSAKNYHRQRAAQTRKMRSAKGRLPPHHPSHLRGGGGGGYEDEEEDFGDGPNTRSLPRHFKLAAHKQPPGSLHAASFYDSSKDVLYVTKAIALICPLPFVQAPHHFLLGLHKAATTTNSSQFEEEEPLSMESVIYNLLYHVPLPPPSRSLQINYWGDRLTLFHPSSHSLPLLDYFMADLFRLLDLDSFLQLFTCVLLENQILLVSKDLYRLMLVAETVTALIFPFSWQHVYVPILPSTLHHFLDAPVPFLMGLHSAAAATTTTPLQNTCCEANLCFVDIDQNRVVVPEDLPAFPHRHDLILELAQVLRSHSIPLGNLNKGNSRSNSSSNFSTPTPATPTNTSSYSSSSGTGSSPFRVRRHQRRKNSWSADSDSGMDSNEEGGGGGSQLNLSSMASMSASYHPAYTTLRPPKHPNNNKGNKGSSSSPGGGGGELPSTRGWVGGVLGSGLAENNGGGASNNTSYVPPELDGGCEEGEERGETTLSDTYLRNLKLNSAIREIFANRFVHMFASYDHFLSQPNEDSGRHFVHNFDKATFLSDQPDQNLPFLSRFIETQMFASLIDRKIASMSSSSSLDESGGPGLEPNLIVFEERIKVLRDQFGESLVRTPSYEPCLSIKETLKELGAGFSRPDFIAPPVREILPPSSSSSDTPPLLSTTTTTRITRDSFPLLNARYLNCGPKDTRNLKLLRREASMVVGGRGGGGHNKQQDTTTSSGEGGSGGESSLRSVFQPKQSTSSPASVAQANWEFVKQLLQAPHELNFHSQLRQELLQECKTKTKRMLVEKMGSEAVALGHGEVTLSGVEENTLVASLCDLLERIWAHGLHVKGKGRSPLWNYLTNFHESEACKDSSKPIDPQLLTPDLSAMASELNLNASNSLSRITTTANTTPTTPTTPTHQHLHHLHQIDRDGRRRPRSASTTSAHSTTSNYPQQQHNNQLPVLQPLPVSIAFDMQNVTSISEIKTEIGYARAWVRLSLEKKVLSKHLGGLLADTELLRGFYKRTAFLRCEDEREQFLYHLLTLNAADYSCFTNSYLNIVLPYRVLIFPSKRFHISTTTANVWISVSGTLGETPTLQLPGRNCLEFVFQHKNLGLLTNMHIGHDNSGVSPKWLVDHILVRNEVTGHLVKFPCGRWLGREVDDGSTERLLVGEVVHGDPSGSGQGSGLVDEGGRGSGLLETPPPHRNRSSGVTGGTRARSPSLPRTGGGSGGNDNPSSRNPGEIQEALGNSVNAIVKYFFKTDRERGRTLTVLLCGEGGLVAALEQVFSFGFKSNRLFGRNIYLWDYFVQAGEVFGNRLRQQQLQRQRQRQNGEHQDGGDDGDLGTMGRKEEGRGGGGGGLGEEEEEALGDMGCYATLVHKINTHAHTLGKNGRFQLLICLCAREHLLPRLPPLFARLQLTRQMYEETSFLRSPSLRGDLVQVLLALDDYDIVLEQSLSKGIE